MRSRWAAVVTLLLTVTGCNGPAAALPTRPAPPISTNAQVSYPVGMRIVRLSRGPDRPLPTHVFYPADAPGSERPAAGRFPLVLFSHGLSGSPERYAKTLATWAAAGFVVAAPRYPYTNEFAVTFRRADIVHQPADARFVIDRVRRLGMTRADPLWHHIDGAHVAAVGHSAGGYTTSGLFTAGHDARLRAGVIMAGWLAPGAFAGPPARMLFLQGTADPIVPVAVSRRAYARVPWQKSYLLLRHDSHGTYLHPDGPGYRRMNATVIAFLRWTLRGDGHAQRLLPRAVYPPMRFDG